MKILYVGPLLDGSTSKQRFSALQRIFKKVQEIETVYDQRLDLFTNIFSKVAYRIGYPLDLTSTNKIILNSVKSFYFDIVWIDKGLTIKPSTLQKIKLLSPSTIIVGYSPDDMAQTHSQSKYLLKGLPKYDFFITTKSYNVSELKLMGVKNPIFIDNSFDQETHMPLNIEYLAREEFGGSVGFIGAFEIDRALNLKFLAESGISVRWWCWQGGKAWGKNILNLNIERRPLWGNDYVKAINSFDINLCFLRKINRDLQTTRSIEIPACGGFMLAERTSEHLELFEEGKEADFFGSKEELLDKVNFYLENPAIRKKIAIAGYNRCLNSKYSNDERLKKIINEIFNNK